MPLTLEEIKERLKYVDEVDLLELLDLRSEDLVDRFSDIIETKADYLEQELDDEETT